MGVLLTLVVVTAISLPIAIRIHSGPLDLSGTRDLPAIIEIVKDRDDIAYPAHVALASLLEVTQAAPTAVGLQWIKAAAHARDRDQLRRTATGLARAQRRAASLDEFWATLCPYIRTGDERLEVSVMERTGARC